MKYIASIWAYVLLSILFNSVIFQFLFYFNFHVLSRILWTINPPSQLKIPAKILAFLSSPMIEIVATIFSIPVKEKGWSIQARFHCFSFYCNHVIDLLVQRVGLIEVNTCGKKVTRINELHWILVHFYLIRNEPFRNIHIYQWTHVIEGIHYFVFMIISFDLVELL